MSHDTMGLMSPPIPTQRLRFRIATEADVPAMAACRLQDPEAGPADSRMAAYFRGERVPDHLSDNSIDLSPGRA